MAPEVGTFFGFKAQVLKRPGKADVYVFSTGMERSKGADVIKARPKGNTVAAAALTQKKK